jgi:hypothetical protein
MKYSLSKIQETPTFVIVDQEQLLFTIRKNSKNNTGKGKREKIAALWTNYDAFVKALNRLFSELWKPEEKMIITSQS